MAPSSKAKTHILQNIDLPSILEPAESPSHIAGTKGTEPNIVSEVCQEPHCKTCASWTIPGNVVNCKEYYLYSCTMSVYAIICVVLCYVCIPSLGGG